jgi:hypothetical protein
MMENDLIHQKNWFQRNWKWALPISIVAILAAILFFSLTAGHLGDFGKAYSEPQLFQGALEKAQENEEVKIALGEIEPVSKMAILEGDVNYSDQNRNVKFTVRVEGKNGKALMDGIAERTNNSWEYKAITIRIKNPPEKRQIIEVLK